MSTAEKQKKYDSDVKHDVETKKKAPVSFSPECTTESYKPKYRFRCPGPGVFQCDLTGLVFDMAQEAEVVYNTAIWEDSLLYSAGKKAAGLLFKIKCSDEAAVCQLHFPHSETKDALRFNGLLSVIHLTDDGMSMLEPLEITDTHVVVKVPHLSTFGLVWDRANRFHNMKLPVEGQVLLFLRPLCARHRILDVIVLQNNIPLHEVAFQQGNAEQIRIPSNCQLTYGKNYSVHCEPEGFIIQPTYERFQSMFGPNYHPSFEVFLTMNTERVNVRLQDNDSKVVWEHQLILEASRWEIPQRNVPAED